MQIFLKNDDDQIVSLEVPDRLILDASIVEYLGEYYIYQSGGVGRVKPPTFIQVRPPVKINL